MGKLHLRRFAPVLWVASAWFVTWLTADRYVRGGHPLWSEILDFLDRFSFRALGGFPAAQEFIAQVIRLVDWYTAQSFATLAAWATLVVPLGFVARIMARARLRSGAVDPLERVRTWVREHPAFTRGVLGVLPVLWAVLAYRRLFAPWYAAFTLGEILPVALASIALQYAGARSAVRAFLSPTVDPLEEPRVEIDPDEIRFDAVAVTPRTLGIVAAFTASMVLFPFVVAKLPILELFRHGRIDVYLFAGYVAFATIGATAFRLASRVAVGVDGVLVKGTAKTRFFAYRDLDGVRVTSGDVELVRRGKAVLRLQLHGADAIRRDAVAARIRENIERVQRGEGVVAAQLVASSTKDALARVASGGADYRAASLSREALWALIEGPTVDSDARRAAAEALAKTSDASERARLRVAAEHCADPHVRVALKELAEEAPAEEPRPATAGRISPFRAA